MNQLEAGMELDRLVAEAIGWTYEIGVDWKPSTDWNAAIDAAAIVAVTIATLYDDATGTWFAYLDTRRTTQDGGRFKGSGDTGPEAISKAILSLKGDNRA
jgi:hypothetical protein